MQGGSRTWGNARGDVHRISTQFSSKERAPLRTPFSPLPAAHEGSSSPEADDIAPPGVWTKAEREGPGTMLLATIRLAASDMVTAAAAAAASAAGGLLAAGEAEGRRGAGLPLAMSLIMTVAAASAGLLTVREA